MNANERSSINRANALHSNWPRTIVGKQRAAMNALKHGLSGQRLILQPEEHEAYRELAESLHAELQPKTTMELQLVHKVIDTHMRLNRVAVLDNNMLNFGLIENLADPNAADDTEIAHAQACSWMAQQISFEKLGRYEGRLSRQLLAYTKELERLQSIRIENEEAQRFDFLREASLIRSNTSMGQALVRHRANRAAVQVAGNAASTQSSASFGADAITPPDPAVPDPKPEAA